MLQRSASDTSIMGVFVIDHGEASPLMPRPSVISSKSKRVNYSHDPCNSINPTQNFSTERTRQLPGWAALLIGTTISPSMIMIAHITHTCIPLCTTSIKMISCWRCSPSVLCAVYLILLFTTRFDPPAGYALLCTAYGIIYFFSPSSDQWEGHLNDCPAQR